MVGFDLVNFHRHCLSVCLGERNLSFPSQPDRSLFLESLCTTLGALFVVGESAFCQMEEIIFSPTLLGNEYSFCHQESSTFFL